MYGNFSKVGALLSLTSAWCMVTPNFLLDAKSTCEILLYPHIFRTRKNILVLVGIAHRKLEYSVSRDAQNVCTVTIVGLISNCFFKVGPLTMDGFYFEEFVSFINK